MTVNAPDNKDQGPGYNPGDLASAERFSGTQQGADPFANVVGHTKTDHDGEEVKNTKNIDDASKREGSPNSVGALNRGWLNNYTGKSDGKKRYSSKMMRAVKKKGPTGLVISLVVGGGAGLGGILTPAGALIHIKEVVVNKMDSISSVNGARSDVGLKKMMFGTSKTCKIKVRCRFNGLSQRQMNRLQAQGAQLLDKDGKPVKKNKLGRFTGGQTLEFPDQTGDGKHRITASNFNKALRNNPDMRGLIRKVHAFRYTAWTGPISRTFRSIKKLTTDQKWGKEGDEKETRKALYQTQSGGAGGAAEVQDNAPEGEDEDAKKARENGANIDFGDSGDDINNEAEKQRELARSGERSPNLPTDPAAVAMMDEYEGEASAKKGMKAALGFLNPLGMVSGMCVIYQLSNAMVLAAKTIVMERAMRFAASFLSLMDKLKASKASAWEVEVGMTSLQREDIFGDDFGAAVGYQYPQYGNVPDKPIASSATGNATIRTLTAALDWIDENVPGGSDFVRTTCKVLTNPFVQGGLALTSFIPGAGTAVKGITSIVAKGGKAIAERQIKKEISEIVKKQVAKATKENIKQSAKKANKAFKEMASSTLGLFLAGYLVNRYAVPWAGRVMAGTTNLNLSGPAAMDTITNGTDATNAGTAQIGGMVPLKKDKYVAFARFNDKRTATYVADMRAKSNPFDIHDPYSPANSVATAYYSFSSKLDLQDGPTSLLALPATILSSLNPSMLLSKTVSAEDVDVESTYCKDDKYLDKHNLASSPFCNVRYGFNDVSMLQNADPDAVIDWMLDHEQIDAEGEAIPESDFAKFKKKCIDDTAGKIISNVGDATQQLDPECYSDKNETQEWKMFRIYNIDKNVSDNMQVPLNDDSVEQDEAPETVFYTPDEQSTVVAAATSAIQTYASQRAAACKTNSSNVLTGFEIYSATAIKSGDYTKKWELSYEV